MTRPFRWLTALIVLGLVALFGFRGWVIVDETEYAVITDFGRIVKVYGAEPGLHAKWPWQSVETIDRRLQVFDPPPREMITGDKRNLEVSSYVVWRVADAVRFLRSAATLETAEARLNERVTAALSHAVGSRELRTLASTDPKVWKLDAITEEVRTSIAPGAREELGVEVVDVRLRRFNHPTEVRPAIFELIRSERKQVAASLRAEGEARYLSLTSQADRQRDTILAEAEAEAERIRGQAESESTRIYNKAHSQDPKFYEFVRTLESYRALLDEKATVVLSSASPLLRLLTQGPSEDLLRGPARDKAAVTPSPTETKP
ncbi:protease modulator HflC [Singulisphaera sp. PoT]|uniref:protease modulator HflC n=1 Tax=Singulisphaera sp. PoT TaxID=3411797 RepID=UPI003BF5319C